MMSGHDGSQILSSKIHRNITRTSTVIACVYRSSTLNEEIVSSKYGWQPWQDIPPNICWETVLHFHSFNEHQSWFWTVIRKNSSNYDTICLLSLEICSGTFMNASWQSGISHIILIVNHCLYNENILSEQTKTLSTVCCICNIFFPHEATFAWRHLKAVVFIEACMILALNSLPQTYLKYPALLSPFQWLPGINWIVSFWNWI